MKSCVILAALSFSFWLPLLCHGNSENCDVDFPPPGITQFVGYNYTISGSECEASLRCVATIPGNTLQPGRSWYIEDVKSQLGTTYNNDYIQLVNIQCPARTVLHLSILNLDVDCGGDFIRVRAESFDEQICGELDDLDVRFSALYNGGFGQILGSNATVEFCTDSSVAGRGFTLVATCLLPSDVLGTACIDVDFARRRYPSFVSIIDSDFPTPSQVPAVHKRNAAARDVRAYSEILKNRRDKRFVRTRFETIQFGENDTVTYTYDPVTRISTVTINFGDGGIEEFDNVQYINTFNDLIRTRVFVRSSPIIFEGEGEVEIYQNRGTIIYSVNDFNAIFLTNLDAARYARTLHSYIYDNWVAPFPIIDEVDPDPFVFPFPDVDEADAQSYRILQQLGWIRTQVEEGSQCRRVFRPRTLFEVVDDEFGTIENCVSGNAERLLPRSFTVRFRTSDRHWRRGFQAFAVCYRPDLTDIEGCTEVENPATSQTKRDLEGFEITIMNGETIRFQQEQITIFETDNPDNFTVMSNIFFLHTSDINGTVHRFFKDSNVEFSGPECAYYQVSAIDPTTPAPTTPAPAPGLFSDETIRTAIQNENACNPVLRAQSLGILSLVDSQDPERLQRLRDELASKRN